MSAVPGTPIQRPIEVSIPIPVSGVRSPGQRRNPYRAYRASLLSPQRVRELSRLRPWISLRDTAWMWLGIAAAWGLVFFYPTWWAVLVEAGARGGAGVVAGDR